MRPDEILAACDRTGCAFVPVSPAFEWHSFHLPLGTDALISEALCREAAETVGGVWFRPLSFGLDGWRDRTQLASWGFEKDDRIFGMNFPDLPLASEYNGVREMTAALSNRLHTIKDCGFRHAFVVNHHGGARQLPTLEETADECSTELFDAHVAPTTRFCTIIDERLGIGGHAGLAETTWLMAFRPDLVDLSRQPDGPLEVRAAGILHRRPTIEAKYNPRLVSQSLAERLRADVTANFVAYVRETAGLKL
jgi:creatinine amidohydrolase/Fe(II)-dependent formamide hydrolase-like protein